MYSKSAYNRPLCSPPPSPPPQDHAHNKSLVHPITGVIVTFKYLLHLKILPAYTFKVTCIYSFNENTKKQETKMGFSSGEEVEATFQQNYDRQSELKAFDDTKAGVKGVVDAGITKVPRIFIHPQESIHNSSNSTEKKLIFPVIDLEGIDHPIKHKEIVDKVRDASETWGFFQVLNHGIPLPILEEMLQGARRFFEQDIEIKKRYYTRDNTKKVAHVSNFDLYSKSVPAASWRDSLYCVMAPNPPSPEELPTACREILMDFSKHMMKLGYSLFELLSEGLGLNSWHLKNMNIAEGLSIGHHYYPACPQPDLTIGTRKHSDCVFMTVLLQDDIGGLQVLHQNQWIDVPPTSGALVVNIGDMLQLISNDKYRSVEHRVLSNKVGPRISVPSFFSTGAFPSSKIYGPIKELLSECNPP
ncbi:1-aminocyclopropane-1-carboxylate oxidase homolog [Nicotiana tabacum]|uniref:1-aminocyclopropane-1-carboxylate oxidase homolog n=1 Tax=Nicotiana tabacum TaxID=4097 RepID=A0A1S3XCQ3_TOBAC|nr:PREDICTED: 1-aminocyclopropane-1-carboxylate oxidase homolog [Nicotiana tabacum]